MEGRIGAKRLKREAVPTKFSFSTSTPKRKTYIKCVANAELRQVSKNKIYNLSWCHKSLILSYYILITSHMSQSFHFNRKHKCLL